MELFSSTLTQMLVLFFFVVAGYILRKRKLLPENAGTVISKLETYFIIPMLCINNFSSHCSIENFTKNSNLILYSGILILFGLAIAIPLSRFFGKSKDNSPEENEYQSKIYSYALTFGNFGYVGNALALALLGEEGLFKYLMFTMMCSITVYSWGMYVLIPKGHAKGNVFKKIINPGTVSLLIGMVIGFLNLKPYIPAFATTAMSSAAACMGPLGMFLLGFVVGEYDIKEFLSKGQVYIATFLRLIVIPSIMMLFLKLINAPENVFPFALIAFAAPLGLNTVVFPSAYGGDTKTGAAMATISHTLAVITLPLMYMFWLG